MPTVLGRGAALLSTVVLIAALVSACGSDDTASDPGSSGSTTPAGPETSGAPPTGGTSPEEGACGSVVPTSVVESLGWDAGGGAAEDRGGCLATSDQGTILVVAVGESYDAACHRLEKAAPGSTYRPTVDNPAGYDACGYVRDDDLGQSEIVVTDDGGRVVSIGVAALQATDPERVRAALLELTSTVSDLP